MSNGTSSVLFLIFCAGNKFNYGNPIESNKYKKGEMNKTTIVIIAIYSTYLSKCCTTITIDHPVQLNDVLTKNK